eukprot:7643027-Alexandrium_andersonii.AAC.1
MWRWRSRANSWLRATARIPVHGWTAVRVERSGLLPACSWSWRASSGTLFVWVHGMHMVRAF